MYVHPNGAGKTDKHRLTSPLTVLILSQDNAMRDFLTSEPLDKEKITQAIINLQPILQDREMRRYSRAGETLTTLLADKIEKEFYQTPHNVSEEQRFSALSRAARALGRQFDEQDADPEHTEPEYHHNGHGLTVVLVSYAIHRANSAFYNKIPGRASDANLVTPLNRMRSLVEALMHDYGHNGKTNAVDGTYRPAYLESKAFNDARPILEGAGVHKGDQMMIWASILATDTGAPPEFLNSSNGSSPNGGIPFEILRNAYNRHFPHDALRARARHWGLVMMEISKCQKEEREKLLLLKKLMFADPFATYNAAVLRAADMVPSFGLDEREWQKNTELFYREINNGYLQSPKVTLLDAHGQPEPAKALYVMFRFCGMTIANNMSLQAVFMTPGAQFLFGENMKEHQNKTIERLLKRPVKAADIGRGLLKIYALR